MATRLRSLFRERRLALVLRAVIFGALFWLAVISGFGPIQIAIFFGVSLFLYSGAGAGTGYLWSFFLLLLLSAFFVFRFAGAIPLLAMVFASAALFYVAIGLRGLFFVYRSIWHYLLCLLLFYGAFIGFFSADKSHFFFLKVAAIFFFILILFKELLGNLVPAEDDQSSSRALIRASAVSGLCALMLSEVIWAISLLPLGVVNSANLAVLAGFFIMDFARMYHQNSLNPRSILLDLTVFMALAIGIFAASVWSI